MDAFLDFLIDNFAPLVDSNNLELSFNLVFIIDEKGKLIGERILNKTNNDLTNVENQILSVLRNSPQWKPGKCKINFVPVLIYLPLMM